MFTGRKELRDVVFAYAFRVVRVWQVKFDFIHAGARNFANLILPRGCIFGADGGRELAPFCIARKAEAKLGELLSSFLFFVALR